MVRKQEQTANESKEIISKGNRRCVLFNNLHAITILVSDWFSTIINFNNRDRIDKGRDMGHVATGTNVIHSIN